MDLSAARDRHAFSVWLRTGRRPRRSIDGIEVKFNPWHDPRNGRFTFGPGGPRADGDVGASRKRGLAPRALPGSQGNSIRSRSNDLGSRTEPQSPAQIDPLTSAALLPPPMAPGPSRTGRGSNIRAFQDRMTLEQVFPGLSTSPGGAIVALADNFLDIFGPSQAATAELTRNLSRRLIEEIRPLDPNYRFESLAEPRTVQGQINQLTRLRFDRAAAYFRARNELRPLQTETLRYVQQLTDQAYERGRRLLREHKLRITISSQMTLGNFIDKEVRRDLRRQYASHGIEAAGPGPVRVNRREDDTSASELTYRRPDARVGRVAFDVTLAPKTLKTPQVRGFFQTDFQPERVIIIRPSQLGGGHTYAIQRPEVRK